MEELNKEKRLRAYFVYFRFKGEDDLNSFFVLAYNRKAAAHIFRVWATAKRFYHRIEAGIYIKNAPISKMRSCIVDREHYDVQFEILKELLKEGEHND